MYESGDKKVFPTRTSSATGQSNERTMLDQVGGHEGIRTLIRINQDGSETRLRTRGGAPDFVTTDADLLSDRLPTYRLVGERMFDRGLEGPYGAFHLTVDFRTSTVFQTEIPPEQYVGTDGTEEYKKYRRNLFWQTADKRRRVWVYVQRGGSYFHGKRIHSNFIPAKLVWFEDDTVTPPTRAFIPINANALGTGIAIYDITHSGTDYVVLATDTGYYDTVTGASMTDFGYIYPPATKPDIQWSPYGERCVYPFTIRSEGRKIAMLPGVLVNGTDRLVMPGYHIYNDVTDTVESHASVMGLISGGSCTITYTPGMPYIQQFNGQGEGTGTYEFLLGAYFSGETLVPIRVVTTQTGGGALTSEELNTWTNRDFKVYHGNEVIIERKCFMTQGFRDGVPKIHPFVLFCPLEWVFAIVLVETNHAAPLEQPLPGGTPMVPTLYVFDFKKGRRYEKTLPVFHSYYYTELGFPVQEYSGPPYGNASLVTEEHTLYDPTWLDYTDADYAHYQSDRANVIYRYTTVAAGPGFARLNMDQFGMAAPTYSDTNLYDTGYDFYDKLRIYGSLHADDGCIVISMQTPMIRWAVEEPVPTDPFATLVIDTNRNDYTNLAIHRDTGTQFEFDNGFGFQSIYKAMETLP